MTITFLSDFGLQDDFVGTCHGVIKRIAPDTEVIDITHGIERYQVLQGALVLASTLPYMPEGVHLAVVDPGVGHRAEGTGAAQRRREALRRAGQRAARARGRAISAGSREHGSSRIRRTGSQPVSRTFHGRDLFAPAAAHLAAGVEPGELGPAIEPQALVRIDVPAATIEAGVDPRPRADRRPLREHPAQPDDRGSVLCRRRARNPRRDRDRPAALLRVRGLDVRGRAHRTTSSSTRTRTGTSRWRSTAAAPPRCSPPIRGTRWRSPSARTPELAATSGFFGHRPSTACPRTLRSGRMLGSHEDVHGAGAPAGTSSFSGLEVVGSPGSTRIALTGRHANERGEGGDMRSTSDRRGTPCHARPSVPPPLGTTSGVFPLKQRASVERGCRGKAQPREGVARAGFEPATPRFSAVCSTD